MRLITDDFIWDEEAFENSIEGMCYQLKSWPHNRVAFIATSTPETVFLFFAIWKLKKIACPLNAKLPSFQLPLTRLGTPLFIPQKIIPQKARPSNMEGTQGATLLFTSGTTAEPKIAYHTLGNYFATSKSSQEFIPLTNTDKWHLSLPLHHVGGISILWRSYLAKSGVILSNSLKEATHLSLVPTQLYRLKKEMPVLPNLKLILVGGAPCPKNLLEAPWPIFPTYGMTEMSSQIATGGKLLKCAEVKIAEDGEILVKGKALFQGYFSLDKPLHLPLDKEGWFATKDLGKWSSDGLLEVIGRKDNLFISGGENIQPEEIEQALKNALDLEEAIVVPQEDAEWGARPVAFLRPFISLEKVQTALESSLPKYKIPIKIYDLPLEKGLKPHRSELKIDKE